VDKVDWGAYSTFHQLRGRLSWSGQVAEVVSLLGWYPVLAVVLLGVVTWLIWQRRVRTALFLTALVVASAVLAELLKVAIGRNRPPAWDGQQGTPLSFPSGHAMVSVVLYGSLAWLLARARVGWRAQAPFYVAAAALVLLIGASQLFLGAHFVSDVLAGWAGGLALLLAATNLMPSEATAASIQSGRG
jgi:undecaprenyl-diphosphatase